MRQYLKSKILNFLIDRILLLVRPEDILQVRGEKMYFMDKELTREAVDILRGEAEKYQHSTLWKVLKADARYQAYKKSLPKSNGVNDVLGAKMMIYLLDVFQTRIDSLTKK